MSVLSSMLRPLSENGTEGKELAVGKKFFRISVLKHQRGKKAKIWLVSISFAKPPMNEATNFHLSRMTLGIHSRTLFSISLLFFFITGPPPSNAHLPARYIINCDRRVL
jgi:hypothetical protein